MNRRQFGFVTMGGAAVAALGLEGCSPLYDLEEWVPVGLAAFDGVAAIVDGAFTAISATVDALWAAAQNAISLYTHSTDPQVTKLDKLIAALDALAGGLAQALAALPISIPAGILTAAKGILALTIATLKGIRDRLQPPTPAPASFSVAASTPPAKSKRDYVSKVNAMFAASGQSIRVK